MHIRHYRRAWENEPTRQWKERVCNGTRKSAQSIGGNARTTKCDKWEMLQSRWGPPCGIPHRLEKPPLQYRLTFRNTSSLPASTRIKQQQGSGQGHQEASSDWCSVFSTERISIRMTSSLCVPASADKGKQGEENADKQKLEMQSLSAPHFSSRPF